MKIERNDFNLNQKDLVIININLKANIKEQINQLNPKSLFDYTKIHNEIYDNCTNTLYMDILGQVFCPGLYGLQYLAKCNI